MKIVGNDLSFLSFFFSFFLLSVLCLFFLFLSAAKNQSFGRATSSIVVFFSFFHFEFLFFWFDFGPLLQPLPIAGLVSLSIGSSLLVASPDVAEFERLRSRLNESQTQTRYLQSMVNIRDQELDRARKVRFCFFVFFLFLSFLNMHHHEKSAPKQKTSPTN